MALVRAIKVNPETWSDSKSQGSDCFWLYCIVEAGSEASGPCKVGVATHMGKRLSSLQGGNWRKLSIAWQVRLSTRDWALRAEQYCLMGLRPSIYGMTSEPRLQSEWVSASPLKVLETALRLLNAEVKDEVRRVA